jgi:hypothetical protein
MGTYIGQYSEQERKGDGVAHWLREATVTDYKSVKAYYERARFPDKGKPLRTWARIHKDGEDYYVKCWNTELCRFKPNNTVVFTATSEEVWSSSNTLSSSLHRAMPLTILRIAKGRYRLAHNEQVIKNAVDTSNGNPSNWHHIDWWAWLKKDAPEYFQGITFDLATGECLNRRPDDKLISIPEKRLHWLRALREFKKGIKVRAKMNIFEGFSDTIQKEGSHGYYDRPDWSHDEHRALLFESIRDNKFPKELLLGITKSYRPDYTWTWARPKPNDVIKETDRICTTYSVELRRQFGVFEQSEFHS